MRRLAAAGAARATEYAARSPKTRLARRRTTRTVFNATASTRIGGPGRTTSSHRPRSCALLASHFRERLRICNFRVRLLTGSMFHILARYKSNRALELFLRPGPVKPGRPRTLGQGGAREESARQGAVCARRRQRGASRRPERDVSCVSAQATAIDFQRGPSEHLERTARVPSRHLSEHPGFRGSS